MGIQRPPLVDMFVDEFSSGGQESNEETSFKDEYGFRGSGMKMRRVESAWCVVDPRHGDTQSVEARDFFNVGTCNS